MLDAILTSEYLWVVICGLIMAFFLAFGIGANDVANTFGTSVGSRVLTLKKACILASIFETLGGVLLGMRVAKTIQTGLITDAALFELSNRTDGHFIYLCGQISALTGSCVWMIFATLCKMPVASTHCIVSAIVGYITAVFGVGGVRWIAILKIAASWFISPVLSGTITIVVYFLLEKTVLKKSDKMRPGLRILPIFYFLIFLLNSYSILHDAPIYLSFVNTNWWMPIVASLVISVFFGLLTRLVLVPNEKRRIKKFKESESMNLKKIDKVVCNNNTNNGSQTVIIHKGEHEIGATNEEGAMINTVGEFHSRDCPEHDMIFSRVQILTAVFGSFAHGSNDVSNAIGPLMAIWSTATTLSVSVANKQLNSVWFLLYGGLGISLGVCVLGWRVIETIGKDLTTITPSSGTCIEFGSALTVLVASAFKIPISTTHCKVGSVVAVGRYKCKSDIKWSIFGKIMFAWFVTLPVSALLSGGTMLSLRHFFNF